MYQEPSETLSDFGGNEQRSKVFLDRYALKGADGKPIETRPSQMWDRVSGAIGNNYDQRSRFRRLLGNFKFVPGGRILAGAGSDTEVTYYNCYVIPVESKERRKSRGTVSFPDGIGSDSREAIFDTIGLMVDIMSRGGGVGINWSVLRPKGAYLKRVNGTSSGPIGWMDVASKAVGEVEQGGSRRGAAMFMIDDWHPDVLNFINAKRDLTKITNANVSVSISDNFMNAVENDLDWGLGFPDTSHEAYDREWDGDLAGWTNKGYPVKTYQTVKAREIWRNLAQAAWDNGEPGVVFLDRYNKLSTGADIERIISVNPCVSGDTLILTDRGHVRIDSVVGQTVNVWNGNQWSEVSPRVTGYDQPMLRVEMNDGTSVDVTDYHSFILADDSRIEARNLTVGDKLAKFSMPVVEYGDDLHFDAYTQGFFAGDGTYEVPLKDGSRNPIIWLYGQQKRSLMDDLKYARASQHLDHSGQVRIRLVLSREHESKTYVPIGASLGDRLKWLAGLMDSDGSVVRNPNSAGAQIWSNNREFLNQVRLMLTTLGCQAKVTGGKPAGPKMMPNGRGSNSEYQTSESYRLLLNAFDIGTLQGLGLSTRRLDFGIQNPDRDARRHPRILRVTRIDTSPIVYCFNEPIMHRGTFNGIIVGQCGEQGLGSYSVCNLGAMNLAAYVNENGFDFNSFQDDVETAVEFLDLVVDKNFYFLPENKVVQKDLRRIGLGVMGLADALIMLGLRYGSEEAVQWTETIFAIMKESAIASSSALADAFGSAPAWRDEMRDRPYLRGYDVSSLRNIFLLTQAPTGTTSILAGVNSGIEPYFAFDYTRKDRTGTHRVAAPVIEWGERNGRISEGTYLPPEYVTATDVAVEEHIAMQAAAQKYIDSSVSKTLNAPNNHTIDDVEKAYMLAYKSGLKGLAYFRDGCGRTQVLYREDPDVQTKKIEDLDLQNKALLAELAVLRGTEKFVRPEILTGTTRKVRAGQLGSAYVTVNSDESGRPVEAFVTVGKAGQDIMALGEALGRLISLGLQYGAGIGEIHRTLHGVGGGGKLNPSLPTAIAEAIFDVAAVPEPTISFGMSFGAPFKAGSMDMCPSCGNLSLVREEGCKKCHDCGYSAC